MKMIARARMGHRLLCGMAVAGLVWGTAAHAQATPPARNISVEQLPVVELQAPPSDLQVEIWANREDGQYLPGEFVELQLRANRDVRVSVLNVDALGRATVLLPNDFTTENALQGDTVYSLPAANANFRLRVNEPFGSNLVKVVATTGLHPILDADSLQRVDGPFAQFRGTTTDLARSVKMVMAEQSQSQWAMADLFIDVVSGRAEGVTAPEVLPEAAPPLSVADSFNLQMHLERNEYQLGESMNVTLTADRDCSLTLVNIEQDQNQATVLYPNRVVEEMRLHAGETTVLPGVGSVLQLAVLGPVGPQTLVGLCTEDPLPALVGVSGLPSRAVYPVLTASQWSALQQSTQQQPRMARASIAFHVVP